jgi:hypothetical protein
VLLCQNKLQQDIAKFKISHYLCHAKSQQGRLAERLGSGLQNRVQQFKSATDLRESATYKVADFYL